MQFLHSLGQLNYGIHQKDIHEMSNIKNRQMVIVENSYSNVQFHGRSLEIPRERGVVKSQNFRSEVQS